MSDQTASPEHAPTSLTLRPVLAVVAFVALIHGAWWLLGDQIVAQGGLADGDSYSRLLRVERLVETGGWFDSSMPRINAPFGIELHWTRPFDVLLIALALPLAPFMSLAAALYWAGVVVSPLLHVGLAVALAWAMIPLLGFAGAAIAGAMTAVQSGILGFAIVGHADHHMLFVLIAAVQLGFMVRALLATDGGGRPAFWAGAVLALGLWVGPEMLLFLALCLSAGGLAWVAGENGAGRMNLNLALGLTAGLVGALLIERGPWGFFDVEYDRVSIIQLTAAVLLLTFWWGVAAAGRRGQAGTAWRLLAGAMGAVAIAAVVIVLFPRVLEGQSSFTAPMLLVIFEQVSEYSPMGGAPHFLFYAGSVVFAGPWVLWRLGKELPGRGRWAWFLIATAVFVYLAFAVNWIRWSLYVGLFLAVVLADLLVHVDEAVNRRFAFPARLAVKAAAVLALVVGPLIASGGALYAARTADEAADGGVPSCPVGELARTLNRPPWSDGSRIIVASANFGAEILYRTRHRVVSTVHHRNYPGFLDGHAILARDDEALVRGLIRKRRVDLIVLCPGSGDDGYFLKGAGEGAFYHRLVEGDVPDWMGEVTLPEELGGFRMFQIFPHLVSLGLPGGLPGRR